MELLLEGRVSKENMRHIKYDISDYTKTLLWYDIHKLVTPTTRHVVWSKIRSFVGWQVTSSINIKIHEQALKSKQ
jgi:hypothetical protein